MIGPRPGILEIEAYVGGESKLQGVNRTIKLSSNENAFGPPPSAMTAYAAAAATLHRYPDGTSIGLRRAIGARYDLDPGHIVCGTGSDELITHICQIYGGAGTDLIMSRHGFSMYWIQGIYAGSRVVKVPERNLTTSVDEILAAVTPATRLVFIANPNNPTGSLLEQGEMERLRAGLPPEVLLVIDAAYSEYVENPDFDAGAKLVDAGDNTVMLRTFSKIYGLGGLRVGWAYAPDHVIDAINRVRGAFNVNGPAQEAAIAALAEPGWVERLRAHNTEWRDRLSRALEAGGIRVWPSEGNFILADFGTPERAIAADAHLKRSGIIVRRVGGYDLPQCLRVTIGTAEECTLVAEALAAFTAAEKADA